MQKRSRFCGRALDRSIWPRTTCKENDDFKLIPKSGDNQSRPCESEEMQKGRPYRSPYDAYMRIKDYRGLSGLSHPFCEYFPYQGIPPNPQIIRGSVWEMTSEHLIMISLVGKGEHGQICSGSIFHSRFILAAGHCFVGWDTDPSSYEVIISLSGNRKIIYKVSSILCHKEYKASSETLLNDICILKTEEEIQFSNGVWPICLPETSNTDLPKCLESADITFQNDNNCSISYSPEQHYCGEQAGESDKSGFLTCDHWHPEPRLYRRNPNTLAGIVSYSSSSSNEKNPVVFTNINHFLPWIFKEINKHDACYPENPCLNGICTDKLYGHECECFEGWIEGGIGTNDCSLRVEDINRCYKNACRNGQCVLDDTAPAWKGYKCECDYGYGGPYCNIITDMCVTINCNSGECKIDENRQPRCVCPVNKTGFFCHLDLIE